MKIFLSSKTSQEKVILAAGDLIGRFLIIKHTVMGQKIKIEIFVTHHWSNNWNERI